MRKNKLLFALFPLFLFSCRSTKDPINLSFVYSDIVFEKDGTSHFEKRKEYYTLSTDYSFAYGHTVTKEDVDKISKELSTKYPANESVGTSGYYSLKGFSLTMEKTSNDFLQGMTLTKDLTFYYCVC